MRPASRLAVFCVRNEPGAPLPGDVVPGPLDEDQHPVLEPTFRCRIEHGGWPQQPDRAQPRS